MICLVLCNKGILISVLVKRIPATLGNQSVPHPIIIN